MRVHCEEKGKKRGKKRINKCLSCHLKQLLVVKQVHWKQAVHRLQLLRYTLQFSRQETVCTSAVAFTLPGPLGLSVHWQ